MKHYEGLGKGNLRTTDWEQTLAPFLDDAAAIFVDPADDDGDVSYALSNKVVGMGANDDKKIAIIESNDRVIDLDMQSCSGTPLVPSITGSPAARHLGTTNALLYGGAVRTFEPADIALDDPSKEPLVVWWLPDREHGVVCGSVVVIDNPNELPGPGGSEPDTEINLEPTPEPSPPSDNPDCAITTGDVLANWTFDDVNDPGADSSGNGHDAIIVDPDPVFDDPERGSVAEFDGVGEFMETQTNIDITGDCYSVTLWFRRVASNNNHQTFVILFKPLVGAGTALELHAHTNSTIRMTHRTVLAESGGSDVFTPQPGYTDESWHHIAGVKDGNTLRVYIDGVQVAEKVDASVYGEALIAVIGALQPVSNGPKVRYFEGLLDDIRIYGRGLSPEEVASLASQ